MLVNEINSVSRPDPVNVALRQTAPFVAQTPLPYILIGARQDTVDGLLGPIRAEDVRDFMLKHVLGEEDSWSQILVVGTSAAWGGEMGGVVFWSEGGNGVQWCCESAGSSEWCCAPAGRMLEAGRG